VLLKPGSAFIKLEIPTPVPEPPTGEGWIHEIKYDGYRTLIVIDQGKVRAYSRPGSALSTNAEAPRPRT
jgi:ATP-dependent DNA ligase